MLFDLFFDLFDAASSAIHRAFGTWGCLAAGAMFLAGLIGMFRLMLA
jgi:hypothetical protein